MMKTETVGSDKPGAVGKAGHGKVKASEAKATLTKASATETPGSQDAWRGFKPGLWQRDVNVRWFIQQNYTPYEGDGKFLAPAT